MPQCQNLVGKRLLVRWRAQERIQVGELSFFTLKMRVTWGQRIRTALLTGVSCWTVATPQRATSREVRNCRYRMLCRSGRAGSPHPWFARAPGYWLAQTPSRATCPEPWRRLRDVPYGGAIRSTRLAQRWSEMSRSQNDRPDVRGPHSYGTRGVSPG